MACGRSRDAVASCAVLARASATWRRRPLADTSGVGAAPAQAAQESTLGAKTRSALPRGVWGFAWGRLGVQLAGSSVFGLVGRLLQRRVCMALVPMEGPGEAARARGSSCMWSPQPMRSPAPGPMWSPGVTAGHGARQTLRGRRDVRGHRKPCGQRRTRPGPSGGQRSGGRASRRAVGRAVARCVGRSSGCARAGISSDAPERASAAPGRCWHAC